MEIVFRASPRSTLGVEVELGIVDRESRELTNAASWLLAEVGRGHPEGVHPKAKHELFESTVEMITGVCTTVADARADLRHTLTELCVAADQRDLALIGSGTHPFSHWSDQEISPDDRYDSLVARIGWPARRLAIHGIHFHVGVRSGEHAVAIANALAHHLPIFLALSASSPYWHGLDTGMASARTKVFEGLPTAGLPPNLAGWRDFESFMGTLIRARAISSIREVWWDVRPHPDFGTVELRMCDAMATLDEITAVAALAQTLVHHLGARLDAGDELPGDRDWVLRENKWLAARFGLEANLIVDDDGTLRPVRELIDELVTELEPTAEELGCTTELEGVRRILAEGAGYERQRRLVASGGSMADLVDQLVAELRCREG